MTIGVIVAMSKELKLIENKLQQSTRFCENGQQFIVGQMAGHQLVLMQCGIGKVASAVGAVELIRRYQPDFIINTGVAGALSSSVRVMDVVVADRTVYHDVDCLTENPKGQIQGFPRFFAASDHLVEISKKVALAGSTHVGLVCSGDQFVSNLAQLRAIQADFPEALAVDMESCSIAQVCYMYGVPFASVRVISDTPGVTAHEAQYYNFWEQAPETSFAVLEQIISNI